VKVEGNYTSTRSKANEAQNAKLFSSLLIGGGRVATQLRSSRSDDGGHQVGSRKSQWPPAKAYVPLVVNSVRPIQRVMNSVLIVIGHILPE
jgi:hypothetical protein